MAFYPIQSVMQKKLQIYVFISIQSNSLETEVSIE